VNRGGRVRDYEVRLTLPGGSERCAADLIVETDHRGRHLRSALRYRGDWLTDSGGFAINPVHAPLAPGPIEWRTRETPAVIDEVMPGSWERTVLRRISERSGHPIDTGDIHAVLEANATRAGIGAVGIAAPVRPAAHTERLPGFEDLAQLASATDRVIGHENPDLDMLRRLRAGSSAGGARPKVLVSGDGGFWLAKFARRDDSFDHVAAEWCCLQLAARAGVDVPESRIFRAGEFKALLVRRFDVTPDGGRRHVLSANALLKRGDDQADPHQPAYEDLAGLIRAYGRKPSRDLKQLFARMLYNEAINNRDDHLRNFSFFQSSRGLELTPAYDLVPSEGRGEYPQLTFANVAGLPGPGTEAAVPAGRAFQLSPREAREIDGVLRAALGGVESVMDDAEMADPDRRWFRSILRVPA